MKFVFFISLQILFKTVLRNVNDNPTQHNEFLDICLATSLRVSSQFLLCSSHTAETVFYMFNFRVNLFVYSSVSFFSRSVL